MSSLETLCHPHFQMHPVAMEILGLLQTLQHRGFCILFCWIPSHVGIAGNEQADHSAKTAASLLHREIPYCDVKKSVARCIFSLWQETWDLQVRNKLHYIKPSIGLWPVLPIRGADVKLTRLRIGHTRATHKHLLFGIMGSSDPQQASFFPTVVKIVASCPSVDARCKIKSLRIGHIRLTHKYLFGERCPACTTCHVNLTVHHILVECPAFSNNRSRFLALHH
ncbi:hypothetical protein AVEN_3185-1 [Araneus ventricosus]|uniref:Uncharacterized protein n=1 Tax=Araneus ventricosus TaxID=182803 RepID=A0A4Y2TVV3_ARAVE|nr:hypothetical protein AVEN_3185-1 [Araneus ventricosus]